MEWMDITNPRLIKQLCFQKLRHEEVQEQGKSVDLNSDFGFTTLPVTITP